MQRGGRHHGRVGQRGRGGRGAPDISSIQSVATNIILASVTDHFRFYQYMIRAVDKAGDQIDSSSRRAELFSIGVWDTLLSEMPKRDKNDLKRVVFFAGSCCYAARPIPGLESSTLPVVVLSGDSIDGDSITIDRVRQYTTPQELVEQSVSTVLCESNLSFDLRCSNCAQAFHERESLLQHCRSSGHSPVYAIEACDEPIAAVSIDEFVSYTNLVLQRAMSERLVKWDRVYVDLTAPIPATDRRGNDLGVDIFQAYSCSFGVIQVRERKACLALTCDIRAKVIRKMSVLDVLYGNRGRDTTLSRLEQDRAKREWIGKLVFYTSDRKCYTVTDLEFEHSAETMPVSGRGMSHAEYFKSVKNIQLEHPKARPMIAVLGQRKQTIYLPAELVTGNELDPRVREQLPKIASFSPDVRTKAIENIKAFLTPGAQTTRGAGGLLPAVGIILESERLKARAQVLPLPSMVAAGIAVPKMKAENWAPMLNKASFNTNPKAALTLNVVVFHHPKLRQGALHVYNRIRKRVNSFRSFYRLAETPFAMEEAGDNERNWEKVNRFFSQEVPENTFVLDFVKPRGPLDPAYPVIKRMLSESGYLSQFVNFNTYAHDNPKDMRRSEIVLKGVARQILQECGVRLWWVSIPKSLPMPAIFVGVDVFHAPMVYDPESKQRRRKASCAAIIIEVIRNNTSDQALVEIYSETWKRSGGNEYQLGDALQQTITNARKVLKVNPLCVVVWRDGIGESEFDRASKEEIEGIRKGLRQGTEVVDKGQSSQPQTIPLAYVVCQKRIATKFLTLDGRHGAPSGTLVKGIQGLKHETFYINGRAPPFSTPKPVRYIIIEEDDALADLPLEELTWGQCHNYPNWTGPIKVPSACQMAHKLAELAGSFVDCGETINAERFKNKIHFL